MAWTLRVGIAGVLVTLATGAGLAQRPAVLVGSVLRDADDAPIRGAEVSLPGLGISVLTDSAGDFRLPAIAPGQQVVWVRRLGYSPLTAVLTFAPGDSLTRDFLLVSTAQKLPTVDVKAPARVSPKLAEFEERRAARIGHFITQAQLDKMQNHKVSEIMNTIPGPYISRAGTAAYIAGGRGEGKMLASGKFQPCFSAIVLDGLFVYQGITGEALFDINSIEPSTLLGIEFYNGAAAIPAKYGGRRSTCGLVVLWTR